MSKTLLALICSLLAFGHAAPAASKAFYEVLRRSADPKVSADGSAIVGAVAGSAFRWTLSHFGVTQEILPIPETPFVHGTDRDGSVVVGITNGRAFRWTDAEGTQHFGAPFATALDVSSDGVVVAGISGGEAFRWTEVDGLQSLGFLPGGTSSRANAIAGDAEVIVGFSVGPVRAFRWTPAAGMQDLGGLPDREGRGLARGVSSGGDVVVGQFDFEAFRWTKADGMVGLGFLSDDHANSSANDVSSDGNRIVGASMTEEQFQAAFLWTPEDGMRFLEEFLTVDEGLDLAGLELHEATGISDDGLVITGWGRRGSTVITWIADLREIPPSGPFQCYDAGTTRGAARFEAREVSLSDRFGDTVQIVKKGKRLCAPVELDAEEASDPEAHLLCYDLVRRRNDWHYWGSDPLEVWASNEFGDDQHLTATRAKRLCVPSTVGPIVSRPGAEGSSELGLDHYLCYAVRANPRDFDPVAVSLADDFQTSERTLKRPVELCNPVDKNGEGILDPDAQLICYDTRPIRGRPAGRGLNLDVLVSNQFGDEQPFTLKKSRTVCVPSRPSE